MPREMMSNGSLRDFTRVMRLAAFTCKVRCSADRRNRAPGFAAEGVGGV